MRAARKTDFTQEQWRSQWKGLNTNEWTLEPIEEGQLFDKIATRFRNGGTSFKRIVQIEQLKNPALYQRFMQSKERDLERGHPSQSASRFYFYGLSKPSEYESVCQYGWNHHSERSDSAPLGSTFYKTAHLASHQAKPDRKRTRRMFVCEVLEGNIYEARDEGGLRVLRDVEDCDSVANSTSTTLTVFKPDRAYPVHLITFLQ